ncbi:MAG: hypothetical protein JXB15_03030 [Anaerolineales bacterium]|nr:hypothetical protein [Anaerolineales bacterium]
MKNQFTGVKSPEKYLRQFSYGGVELKQLLFTILFSLIAIPILLVIIIAESMKIYRFLFLSDPLSPEILLEIPALFFGAYVVFHIPELVNQYNRIRVADEGLYVRVFIYRFIWMFLPWSEIIDTEIAPILDRWMKPMFVIKVKKLTSWHKYLGQQYGVGFHPVILLASDLENRSELLRYINEKLTPPLANLTD